MKFKKISNFRSNINFLTLSKEELTVSSPPPSVRNSTGMRLFVMCQDWWGGIQSTTDPSTNLQRGLYENISFVYGRAGFVLHVASMGDKVRVTRSTLGRNRKCCCEHQLLLRSARAARGLGLPRHCQIKRLLCCVRQFALLHPLPPPLTTFTFQRC